MRTALLLFTVLQLVRSSCPESLELVRDGQCRGLYATVTTTSKEATNDAISLCKEIRSQPIIIHSEEENAYWPNWKEQNGKVWPIGLICNTQNNKWEWTDGSALDFKPKNAPAELNSACKTGCSWTQGGVTDWRLLCDDTVFPAHIFCTQQLQLPLPTGCDNFQVDNDDDICYQVGETAESWQEAQMNCRFLGADLASIHNTQENSFVRRLAVSRGAVSGIYLGGTISGKATEFGWIDGSAWHYTNFHPGFPMDGYGACLAMDTSSSTGLWMNRDCSTKLPVACIRNETDAMNDPTCKSVSWTEGELMTSPGFPYNASIQCEFFLKAEQGKTVELEIIMLEANTCCDSLQIYDDYLGGKLIANITGEVRNATYTTNNQFMKVVWNPNGGVNVKGVAMVFRGV